MSKIHRRRYQVWALFWLGISFSLILDAGSQGRNSEPSTDGTIADGHLYKNPVLDMTIVLSGQWQLRHRTSDRARPDSSCRGPLCSNPDINFELVSQPGSTASDSVNSIRLTAFKLSPQYLDRKRYPLNRFAETMMTSSLEGTGIVADGKITNILLDHKPGYRLMAASKSHDEPDVIGYVSESNGYVFLMVAAASSTADLPKLQAAIENMKLSR